MSALEFLRAGDEIRGRAGAIIGTRRGSASRFSMAISACLLLDEVEIIDLAEPARQLVEVAEARSSHRSRPVFPSCRARRISCVTTALSSAAGVTTRMKCWRSFDFSALSI